MQLSEEEKKVVKSLIEKELKKFEKEEEQTIRDSTPKFFAAEIKYDEFLKKLLKKL